MLSGLQSLNEPCEVTVYSDSQYMLKAMSDWLPGWVRNGWKNSQKKPVANADQWKEMLIELDRHKIITHWVKGHAGHPENEFCDQVANEEAYAVRA